MNSSKLLKQGIFLEYLTLAWNVVGTGIAVWAGIQANSISLFGFGIDSAIEILASIVVVWQLKAANKDNEEFALKLIGAAFMALSVYLLFRAAQILIQQIHPLPSAFGALWLLVTAIAMLLLAYGKRRIGKSITNRCLMEESIVTLVDGLLAIALLVGVLLNMFYGLWWADPVACLVLVFLGAREAMHIFRGEHQTFN